MTKPEKPLHVRVGEALGCHPYLHDDAWFCDEATRAGGPCEGRKANPWQHDGPYGSIAHFDTDWAATGPLIERYGITVGLSDSGPWSYAEGPQEIGVHSGSTYLEAVCNYILALKEAGKLNA